MSVEKGSYIFEKIKTFKMFEDFLDSDFDEFLKILKVRNYDKNERIYWQEDSADSGYIIYSGLVKLEKTVIDGKAKTLNLLTEGEGFGFSEVIAENKRTSTARTLSKTTILVIEKNEILKIIINNSNFTNTLLRNLSRKILEYNIQIEELTFLNLRGRVAALLKRLSLKFGVKTEKGIKFKISLSQREISDMVGTNRETVCKVLQFFLKKNIISINKKVITILSQEGLEKWKY